MVKTTLSLLRSIFFSSKMKSKRNAADFLADRIIQATTESSLLYVIERLFKLLDVNKAEVNEIYFLDFFTAIGNEEESKKMLSWLRVYPQITAMVCILKQADYNNIIDQISLDEIGREGGVAPAATQSQIPITMTCLSPLSHGSDIKAGNATLFRRMKVLSSTGDTLCLPYYAGNAIRGQIRDLLADNLISSLGLKPSKTAPPMELWFFHALYAGGALEEGGEATKALNKELGKKGVTRAKGIYLFRDNLPGLSLLGCALGNRILPGRVMFGDFRPACTQWNNGDNDVYELFEWTFLTRREDHEAHEENHSMIANSECLKTGTVLSGGIDMDHHISDLERSVLGKGLQLLTENGYIGAENRRGLGSVKIEIQNAPSPLLYEKFLKERKAGILEYLNSIGAICTQ